MFQHLMLIKLRRVMQEKGVCTGGQLPMVLLRSCQFIDQLFCRLSKTCCQIHCLFSRR
uniref:TUBGCP5 n=1 Tax=Arundo donax TaxID=35708 RepID=A0A0A9D7M2_ARUDO